MKRLKPLKHLFFLIPLLTLLSISLLLMYHSTYISNVYSSHFTKQLTWFIIGLLLLILGKMCNTQILFKYSKILYLLSIFLLILVLFIGENINGARAWINFHYFLFQPSELMKLTYSLYLSHLVYNKHFYNLKQEFLFLCHVFLLFLIPTILVFLEPDTGAILFYLFITLAILWKSKLKKRWFVLLGFLSLSFLGFFFYTFSYQKDFLISLLGTSIFYRMERLLNLGTGMQIEHALIAIGSAPFFCFHPSKVGIYIPEAPTDFAFSLTSNVLGIGGLLIILLSYFILDCYLLSYSKNIKKKEYQLFATSFLSIFIPSQIINIGMNLGILPIIGIPLPLLSYGGSSTMIIFLYLAIIFSHNHKKKESSIPIETLVIND